MKISSQQFKTNAAEALLDEDLKQALNQARDGFVDKRARAFVKLDSHRDIRESARQIKDHTLAHLDHYLSIYERNVCKAGGVVHWARDETQAREIVLGICAEVRAKKIIKGKSMIGEEVSLNEALIDKGYEVVETDLGEYIIQLAEEPPSHIIAPAVHKTRRQITELFYKHHQKYGLTERVTEIPDIVNEARSVLREVFLSADVGITGANFLVAETGSAVLVTNEGNGDLTSTLPETHIVTTSIEKVIPTLDDLGTMLRLLARSGTGQEITSYTTLSTGPRRSDDQDGPKNYHVVILDNGRSDMLAGEFREMLRCIRCGACLNHCPVYGAVGGHAYGWVYSGPMGSVLTPLIIGLDKSQDLPNACTLNGRCAEMCPMSIPLPDLLRKLRQKQYESGATSPQSRWGLGIWAWFAVRPKLYAIAIRLANKLLRLMPRRRGAISKLPLAGGWTRSRNFPVPQTETFQSAYAKRVGTIGTPKR